MNLRLTVVAALFSASLLGCVTVEMPKHMVSDVVGAGKDLYKSVDRSLRKEPKLGEVESNSAGTEFWLASSGSADASVAELKRTCVETLVAGMREKVGPQQVEYRIVDQRIEPREADVVVRCKLAVERPAGDGA